MIRNIDGVQNCGTCWYLTCPMEPRCSKCGVLTGFKFWISDKADANSSDRNGGPSTNKANGGSEDSAEICPNCEGKGWYNAPYPPKNNVKVWCDACSGKGKLHHS